AHQRDHQSLAQRQARRRGARCDRRPGQGHRYQSMRRPFAAALAAALLLGAGPSQAQDEAASSARVEAFAELPYWPGYWVSEQYANTTIGGFAAPRPAGSPPLQRLNAFNAPWNEEGQARQAEAARTRGGRRADGWGYPMMMDAATPIQFMITPEE